MSEAPQGQFGWEQLVTDGHVRAARVRRRQPRLIAVAILFMIVGWVAMGLVRPPKAQNNRSQVLGAQVEREQWRAIDAFAGMPQPRIGAGKVKSLPLGSGVAAMQAGILAELNQSGGLPKSMDLQEVEPPAFWRSAWKPGAFVTTGTGSVRLVGGLVNSGNASYAVPARWLAVFRKENGEWTSVTIHGPDFIQVEKVPAVDIKTIPVTLKPLLDTKD